MAALSIKIAAQAGQSREQYALGAGCSWRGLLLAMQEFVDCFSETLAGDGHRDDARSS
jgi:hypothetical protein